MQLQTVPCVRLCGSIIHKTLLLLCLMFGVLAIARTSAHGADVKVHEDIAAGRKKTRPRGLECMANG